MKRAALLVGILLATTVQTSIAQAGVEVGGTAGLHVFSDTNALGVETSDKADSQKNSTLFALRFAFYFTSMFGVEAEGGFVPTEPRSITADIYNATYRGHFIAQFGAAKNDFIPFVLLGGGAMEIIDIPATTTNLKIHKDRDGIAYFGAGLKYRAQNNWGVRFDARVALVPSSTPKEAGSKEGGITQDFEFLLGIYREFGRAERKIVVEKKTDEKKDNDPDKDGVLGDADKCPTEAEDVDGFEDENGCADLDNDGDGIPDKDDKCLNAAEDKDSFKDDDGCPELDNDEDGVPDATDKCINEPETKNGFDDEDGCKDELPAGVTAILGAMDGVTFKPNTADLLPASNKALDKAAAALVETKSVKVEIGAHTEDVPPAKGGKFKDNLELSQARADAVKAYLAKKGVEEPRLTAKGYGDTKPSVDPAGLKGKPLADARTKNRRVELTIVMDAAPPAAAPPAPPAP